MANNFNPIEEFLDQTFMEVHAYMRNNSQKLRISSDCKSANTTKKEILSYEAIYNHTLRFVQDVKKQYGSIIVASFVCSVIYGSSCVLMMIGCLSQKIRYLMLPYLCIQPLLIIMLFYSNIFMNLTMSFLGLSTSIYYYTFLLVLDLCLLMFVLYCLRLTEYSKSTLVAMGFVIPTTLLNIFTYSLKVNFTKNIMLLLLALRYIHVPLIISLYFVAKAYASFGENIR